MVTTCATRRSATHLAVKGNLAPGIWKSLNLMVELATAAAIRQLRTDVAYLSFAASDEEITNSTFTNHKLLLMQPIKSNDGPASEQQTGTSYRQRQDQTRIFAKRNSIMSFYVKEDKAINKNFLEILSKHKNVWCGNIGTIKAIQISV